MTNLLNKAVVFVRMTAEQKERIEARVFQDPKLSVTAFVRQAVVEKLDRMDAEDAMAAAIRDGKVK